MSKFAALRTFISADMGNVVARHELRMQAITHYLDVALRGNKTQLIDGLAFANSQKGKVAKAYIAGFQACGMPEKYPYEGKLSAEVAEQIADRANELASLFSKAFADVMPVEEPAEKTDEEKAKAKAEKEAKAKANHEAWAKENGYMTKDQMAEQGIMLINDMTVAQVVGLINGNLHKFSASELASMIAKATAALSKAQMNEAADAIDDKADRAKADKAKAKAEKEAKANGLVTVEA